MLFSLLALSAGTAAWQAVHKLETLGVHAGSSFDPRIVVAICLVSIATIFLATRIRRVPLPAGLVLALGGLTYPFYLLHMQIGYVLYTAAPGNAEWEIPVVTIIAILSWAIWRFVDRPAQRRCLDRRRFPSRQKAGVASILARARRGRRLHNTQAGVG